MEWVDGNCHQTCAASKTAITKPCAGKNGCNLYEAAANGEAIGYCSGGCNADDDCWWRTEVCYRDARACVRGVTAPTYPKSVGEACSTSSDCYLCEQKNNGDPGYCLGACIVGAADQCPAGFAAVSDCPDTTNWTCSRLSGGTQNACRTN